MFLCFHVSPAQAQNWLESDLEQSLKAREAAKEGEVNLESWIEKAGDEAAISFGVKTLGLEWDEKNKTATFSGKGTLNELGTLIAGMYVNPPASFTYYVYDVLQNAGLAPKAYAQGIGFSGLTPIMPLWKAFRNIAYMLIVVILIVIGFMIMFRMKIDPQTVISIQSALPRIAITLLLITFSYAIVGLMIDLMYLGILLVASVLGKAVGLKLSEIAELQSYYTTGGLGTLLGAVFSGGFEALDDFFKALLPPNAIAGLLIGVIGGVSNPGGLLGLFGGALLPTGLFLLIFSLSLLFIFIRLLIILLSSYIQIILALIFGPIQILFDAIPGKSGFMGWFLGIVANLIVFPVTAAMLILGTILTTSNINPGAIAGSPGKLWSPPLVGALGGGSSIVAFIGVGMLMLTPSMASKAKKMLQPKPTMPIGPGAIFSPFGMAAQQTMSTASQFQYGREGLKTLGEIGGSLMTRKKPSPPRGEG